MYTTDLAYIHHAGYTDWIREAGPEVIELLREEGISEGRVIDLGCGDGAFLRQLERAGYDFIGVDISSDMIDLAARTIPATDLYVACAFDFKFPECSTVVALSEVLGYMPEVTPEKQSLPAKLTPLFERVYAALRPGGILLFDLIVLDEDKVPMNYRTWKMDEEWGVLVDVVEERELGFLKREIITFRKHEENGNLFQRHHETHLLHLPRAGEVLMRMEEAGFESKSMEGYRNFQMRPRRVAFLGRKPEKSGS
jgi:SAM-dependent methyltransferase